MTARPPETLELHKATNDVNGEDLFKLGIIYASGRSVPADLLAAHMWFNLSAQRGNHAAARLRREIAAEMSAAEVAAAQRAARDWVTKH
jgi:TPR repeat protein